MSKTIHTLKVTLKDSKPPIWRRVAVPSDIKLSELHLIIQIAMGWTNSHMHRFVHVDKSIIPTKEEMKSAFAKDPWDEEMMSRMHGERCFVTQLDPWGEPTDMDGEDEDAFTLADICPKVKDKLFYEYDFGDDWVHQILVEKVESPESGKVYPLCLTGRKACPPEDCGGIFGYYHMLKILDDPSHEEHEHWTEWIGDDFDPDELDIQEINEIFKER